MDLEPIISFGMDGFLLEGFDSGQGRCFCLDADYKFFQSVSWPADLNFYTAGCVPDPSFEGIPCGKTVYEWTEANTLDDAVYQDPVSRGWVHIKMSCRSGYALSTI